MNQLLNRVDLYELLDRVDVNALLDRVDVDALMAKADVDALLERVDVKALVDRAGIPEIVAESTGRPALLRTLTCPLSFAVFGVGLLGVFFNTERRAWHDRFAGSAVVYDWGSRTVAMPTPLAEYLRRKGAHI